MGHYEYDALKIAMLAAGAFFLNDAADEKNWWANRVISMLLSIAAMAHWARLFWWY